MLSPLVVLLDSNLRSARATLLKSCGYSVFATEHVVEVCLRLVAAGCAALVIGPQIPWREIATLCEWFKINHPDRPILLLSERRAVRPPAHVDAVVPVQPVQVLLEELRIRLAGVGDQASKLLTGPGKSSTRHFPSPLAMDHVFDATAVGGRTRAKRSS